ncbi:formylglycine-generating enzyme family protein [Lunatibacter salilacus]|uniref:formylglycine-generating enzyme family protein n=1 Tax=Lunatibacter salilacus TaxID=2483804 RepID=UPI00131B3B85|nr:formylglycine-generating enzyme family protein [Lunatibacter salilacus]
MQLLEPQVVLAQENNPPTQTNMLGMEFILIQPGTMVVGRLELQCPDPPESPYTPSDADWMDFDYIKCQELIALHSQPGFSVKIENPYYIGKFEVTQKQWETVMGDNPSVFQENKLGVSTDNFPVEKVTWKDVQKFTQKLNELDSSTHYRLPTEFEWEYAARAGESELLSWAATKKVAWIQDTDKGSPQEVGQMEPNAWGLYDMLGNVWEWVEDFYNDDLFASPTPPTTGTQHVLKGGSFTSDVVNAHYFFHGAGPGNGYDVGFRVVMEAKK